MNTYVSISALRHHFKCTLPVELVHNGEEEAPAGIREMFKVMSPFESGVAAARSLLLLLSLSVLLLRELPSLNPAD